MSYENEPKKSLGQHWLKDQASLEAICRVADIQAGDKVLEIGPGTGELTQILIDKQSDVTAVEIDDDLINQLESKFKSHHFKLAKADIRKFDLTSLPANYKIVANIPYYLTAYLLRLLIETPNKPSVAALLVQKEVAERVAAEPGKLSFIAVAVQLEYEVSLGQAVPAELFTPPPKVDSQILVLKRLPEPQFNDVDRDQFLKFIKAGFAQPRKTLVNNFSSVLKVDRDNAEAWLAKSNLFPTARAQELSLSTWHTLYQTYLANPPK